MKEEEIKEIFHALFNKINNICVAAAVNKKILEEEKLDEIHIENLKESFKNLIHVLSRIEDNARNLDKALQAFYETIKQEYHSSSDPLKDS